MNLRWLIFDYIDPELNIGGAERRRLRRRAWSLATGGSTSGVPKGVVPLWARLAAPIVPAFAMIVAMLPNFLGKPISFLDIGWMVLIQAAISWILIALIGRWTWRPAIWLALREAGYDVCIHCGYWLRSLSDDVKRCPECGAEREPVRKQKLEACDLANPAIVQAMQSLGYTVCRECGLMILAPSATIESNCPECGSPRDTMPGRSSTED